MKLKDDIFISGDISAQINLVCSRCLKGFIFQVEPVFKLSYELQPVKNVEDLELKKDELDISFYDGESIDITTQLVLEQIVLNIPMKPLCKDSCLGLCSNCGKNLNEGDCGCVTEEIDPRLAILKNLKLKDIEEK